MLLTASIAGTDTSRKHMPASIKPISKIILLLINYFVYFTRVLFKIAVVHVFTKCCNTKNTILVFKFHHAQGYHLLQQASLKCWSRLHTLVFRHACLPKCRRFHETQTLSCSPSAQSRRLKRGSPKCISVCTLEATLQASTLYPAISSRVARTPWVLLH
jgi:hypothetical protein